MQNWREIWLPLKKGELTILGGELGGLFLLTVGVKKKSTVKWIQHIQFPAFFSISILISI